MPLPLILERSGGFYRMPLFEALGVRALFTTRRYDMTRGTPSRLRGCKEIGLSASRLVSPVQVHGDSVRIVSVPGRAVPETDALITDTSRLPLTVQTADCLPVFIFDGRRRVIALVHAGWRGMQKNIISKTVRTMRAAFSSRPSDLLAALGPSIRSCCYEVGKEFLGYFPSSTVERDGKRYFDLAGAAGLELLRNDVAADHIYDSRLCTFCLDSEFFSYRREGAGAGRSMAAMELFTGRAPVALNTIRIRGKIKMGRGKDT